MKGKDEPLVEADRGHGGRMSGGVSPGGWK